MPSTRILDLGKERVGANLSVRKLGYSSEHLILTCLCLFWALQLLFWFSFQNRIPSIDESGHILDSLAYRDLLKHSHLTSAHWWYQLFTVNRFYPPLVHVSNGLLKTIFGTGRIVDVLSLALFNIVLTGSAYGITRRLGGSIKAALISAIVINCYPEIALLNRAFWLDFPLVAMVALALYTVLTFNERQTLKNAILAGACLGLAAMTKQIAISYLILPAGFVILRNLVLNKNKQAESIQASMRVATLCAITLAICAPWLYLNAGQAKNIADECAVHIARSQSFGENLSYYLSKLSMMMSPYLLVGWLIALFGVRRDSLMKILPLFLSAAGGLLAISALAWIFPKPQYLAPALIGASVVTGLAASRLKSPVQLSFVAVALIQLIFLEFTPYPVPIPLELQKSIAAVSGDISEPRVKFVWINPHPKLDWGQEWVLDTIETVDGRSTLWLNILSNSPDLNVHTFELLAHDRDSKIKPTSSRIYSIGGDTVEFSPAHALDYQWFLIPNKNSYQRFANDSSEKAFEELKTFVAMSGKFTCYGSKELPDKTKITLYRRN